MGVTSASPQYACIREKAAFMCLIAGTDTPWVCAAPRATVVQKPSTAFGVTRTSRTGGTAATYSDQLLKSVNGFHAPGAASGEPVPLWRASLVGGSDGYCAA